jgi:hypothetical protein
MKNTEAFWVYVYLCCLVANERGFYNTDLLVQVFTTTVKHIGNDSTYSSCQKRVTEQCCLQKQPIYNEKIYDLSFKNLSSVL